MVIKGAQMGIPFLLSRSGLTQTGHMVAERLGMSLVARCTGKHFLLLAGSAWLILEPQLADVLRIACPCLSPHRLNGYSMWCCACIA